MSKYDDYETDDVTVELDLVDGGTVNCSVVKILTVEDQDYIVLMPLDGNGEPQGEEVWFYRYDVDEKDPGAEPQLGYIDDDDEYEMVADAFDEYLDECEFNEMDDD